MVRAEAALPSARPDSIQGLAQAIAKPAYRRLLIAEPTLRRAVPVLIVAFLLTVGIAAVVQSHNRYQQAIRTTFEQLYAASEVAVDRLNHAIEGGSADILDPAQTLLQRLVPPPVKAQDRTILIVGDSGKVFATAPAGALSASQAGDV
ncbi:MAG TPA: PAS domain-containing sensor histidine kinase, partial [Xanthobacteraceae bacterium]|nr:PAS domain-containing sensor histidine kinase [Xanthobacteraceae bacterium]